MSGQPSGTRVFLRGARRAFQQTGAIAPSSRFLARSITSGIREQGRRPLRVLEAGAGTGALTGEILRCLPEGSTLDIYEINPAFASYLEERFCGVTGNGHTPRTVRVHNRKAEEVPAEPGYDAIVSGLPLNNFRPAEVRQILTVLMQALKPGGVMSYFEYLMLRELKSLAVRARERRRLRKIGMVTGRFLDSYEFRRDAVVLNIPPALVHHLRKPR